MTQNKKKGDAGQEKETEQEEDADQGEETEKL